MKKEVILCACLSVILFAMVCCSEVTVIELKLPLYYSILLGVLYGFAGVVIYVVSNRNKHLILLHNSLFVILVPLALVVSSGIRLYSYALLNIVCLTLSSLLILALAKIFIHAK